MDVVTANQAVSFELMLPSRRCGQGLMQVFIRTKLMVNILFRVRGYKEFKSRWIT